MLAVVTTISTLISPATGAASFAYACMLLGFALRKKSRIWHSRLMLTAIAVDLSLVIILQSQRNVIKTAVGPTLEWVQRVHIASSLGATLLYVPLLYLGYRLWRSPAPNFSASHRRLGIAAFCLRTVGFITMFTMIS